MYSMTNAFRLPRFYMKGGGHLAQVTTSLRCAFAKTEPFATSVIYMMGVETDVEGMLAHLGQGRNVF